MEKKTLSILVAEDNDSNFELLCALLRREYTLLRAVNGLEAITVYNEKHPDLILMDLKMPEMGGLEAVARIRELSVDVPIFAVTAHSYETDRKASLEAGCNEFITKPIDIKVLMTLLARYLK